eukprot:11380111-Alexandrium_andersonii.AAC.1
MQFACLRHSCPAARPWPGGWAALWSIVHCGFPTSPGRLRPWSYGDGPCPERCQPSPWKQKGACLVPNVRPADPLPPSALGLAASGGPAAA